MKTTTRRRADPLEARHLGHLRGRCCPPPSPRNLCACRMDTQNQPNQIEMKRRNCLASPAACNAFSGEEAVLSSRFFYIHLSIHFAIPFFNQSFLNDLFSSSTHHMVFGRWPHRCFSELDASLVLSVPRQDLIRAIMSQYGLRYLTLNQSHTHTALPLASSMVTSALP